MAAIDDLRADIADLQSTADAENAELQQAVSNLQAAEATITQLQTQISQGGGVSEADLEALATSVSGVTKSLKTATDAAATTSTPAPGGAAPSGDGGAAGGSAPDPAAPAGGSAPDPSAGGSAPAGGTDTGGAAPAGGSGTQERAVYVHDGDPSSVDTTVWPTAPLVTAETPPRQLYYYAGDTQPGQVSGDGVAEVWHAYTGETQPAPQPAAADEAPGEGAGAGPSAGSELAPGSEG